LGFTKLSFFLKQVCQHIADRFWHLVLLPSLNYIHLRRPQPTALVGTATWSRLYEQALTAQPNIAVELMDKVEKNQQRLLGSDAFKYDEQELADSINAEAGWYYRQNDIGYLLQGRGEMLLKPAVAQALKNKQLAPIQQLLLRDQLAPAIQLETLATAAALCISDDGKYSDAKTREIATFFDRFYPDEAIQAAADQFKATTVPHVAQLLQQMTAKPRATPLVPKVNSNVCCMLVFKPFFARR
jgi:hypothetical protein